MYITYQSLTLKGNYEGCLVGKEELPRTAPGVASIVIYGAGRVYVRDPKDGRLIVGIQCDTHNTSFEIGGFGGAPVSVLCPRCQRVAAPEHIHAGQAKCWYCGNRWSL
jgi:hypothetical protein